ncbi:MAG: glycine/D-amino acid oxidase-like deaminating enzyme [Sphingobacteriales bacterium]|jgi:glycine/D-amino acid oxidase-like deaminating enzyme
MNLSYWEKNSILNGVDVLIVGGGIVGLCSAIMAKKRFPNQRIVLLEKHPFAAGASTKNAGFACFGSIGELIEHEKLVGEKAMKKLIQERWEGLQLLFSLIDESSIELEHLGGFEVFDSEESLDNSLSKLDYYNHLVEDIVGANCFEKQDSTRYSFNNVSGVIRNKYESQLHSGKLFLELKGKCAELGVEIFNGVTVLNVEENMAETDVGVFNFNKALLCTNAFAPKLAPSINLKPGRGQILITKAIPNLQLKGSFHYDKGYFYFRNIHNRVLLGGGRNEFETNEQSTNLVTTSEVQDRLEVLLQTVILPNTKFEIESRWSGVMAFNKSGLPILEELDTNVFFAGCSNGMGVALGAKLAKKAVERL